MELPKGVKVETRIEYAYSINGRIVPMLVSRERAEAMRESGHFVYERTLYSIVDDRPAGGWDYLDGKKP